jgi:hypothetical protein
MDQKEVAQLAFTEALTGDEVFLRISVVNEYVAVLLTTRHHGDIEVFLDSIERKQVLEALEKAVEVVQTADSSMQREIGGIRSGRTGSKMEHVVNIRVERGLVVFQLALEGDENEEDMVWVYLTNDQCKWLIDGLRKVQLGD